MADHALARLRPEDVQRRTQLVELREKAVAAQTAQVTQTSYLLGKLPVETLVGIFSLLIDEDHTWAVKLSHVCGHWRQILIDTPSAWQTLVLTKKRPVQKAKLWKQRTKNRINRINVSMPWLDRAAVFAELQDLSWNDLSSLCISGEAFVELHCMLSDISFPHAFSNLDELTLFDFTSAEQLSCCLSGPDWKLRILRLNGVTIIVDEWWQRIRRLKELCLTGSVNRFSTLVFTSNPLLERLVLAFPISFDSGMDNVAPTPMDNLKSVECRAVPEPLRVLRVITAPSITYFGISSAASMVDETLLHMACRSSLVELYIAHCSFSPHTLQTVFSSTPNLETLRVNHLYGVVNEMFQFLTPKVVDSLPCRALRHVDVSGCSDLTTSSLYAFVKTRIQYASDSVGPAEKCAVIASLKVDKCPGIEPDMLPWFRSKIAQFSCVYATKKDFVKSRR